MSLGEDLPIAGFEDMLEYLRFFAAPELLDEVRNPGSDTRSNAWRAFLRETDSDPTTPEHEPLREYFRRLRSANEQYREEGVPGWRTDRGMVYAALGQPDSVGQSRDDADMRGRTMVWFNQKHTAEISFVDQSGFGRWRLTPASDSAFQRLTRRLTACPVCR